MTNCFDNFIYSMSNIKEVSCEEFAKLIAKDSYTVIDMRTPGEIAEVGKITERAVNIDYFDPRAQELIANLDPKAKYAVHCRSGNRTSLIRHVFENLGFEHVRILKGGANAWFSVCKFKMRSYTE